MSPQTCDSGPKYSGLTIIASSVPSHFIDLIAASNFGARSTAAARKMRRALKLILAECPDLEVEGEMQANVALNEELRLRIFPNSRLKGRANLLIMPTLDAANISFNLLKTVGGAGITVGPMLLGCARPVHILSPQATVRRIINMTALTVVEAGQAG